MSQFGIVIEPFPLDRRCPCGHQHECEAYAITSAVPKHRNEHRPIRSKVAWYVGDPNPGAGPHHVPRFSSLASRRRGEGE